MRRRLFEGEIGIQLENREHMELLANMLEIESDGGDSPGEFVSYILKRFDEEVRARFHEKRASKIRAHSSTTKK